MAKILFGAGVGDARGSIGSLTFTKGRNGAVIRAKVSPVQPRSPAVMAIRAFFATLSQNWANTLTVAQRAAWSALGAITTYTNSFGNTYHPTGLQLYQGCNRNLQLINQALIADAPADLDVDTPLTLEIVADFSTQLITATFTPSPVPTGHTLCFDGGYQQRPGRSFVGNAYKFFDAEPATMASPVNKGGSYIAKFGALRLGQKVPMRIWLIKNTTGAASQEIAVLTAVVA